MVEKEQRVPTLVATASERSPYRNNRIKVEKTSGGDLYVTV